MHMSTYAGLLSVNLNLLIGTKLLSNFLLHVAWFWCPFELVFFVDYKFYINSIS